jgi:hypothetical protein
MSAFVIESESTRLVSDDDEVDELLSVADWKREAGIRESDRNLLCTPTARAALVAGYILFATATLVMCQLATAGGFLPGMLAALHCATTAGLALVTRAVVSAPAESTAWSELVFFLSAPVACSAAVAAASQLELLGGFATRGLISSLAPVVVAFADASLSSASGIPTVRGLVAAVAVALGAAYCFGPSVTRWSESVTAWGVATFVTSAFELYWVKRVLTLLPCMAALTRVLVANLCAALLLVPAVLFALPECVPHPRLYAVLALECRASCHPSMLRSHLIGTPCIPSASRVRIAGTLSCQMCAP